jgi:hypothetical protein
MDEEQGKHKKLDYIGVGAVMAYIFAFGGDLLWFAVIGALIPPPPIGLTFLAAGLLAHYLAGVMVGGFIFFELKHFIPKLILGAAILLPLPLLMLGIAIAFVAQNRIIEALLIQGATKLVEAGLVMTGVGTLAAGAIEAAADAKTAQTLVAGGRAVTTAAKGAEAAKGAQTAAKGAEAAKGAQTAETAAQRARRYAQRLAQQGGGGDEEDYGEGEEDEGGEGAGISEEALGVQRGPLEELEATMSELPPIEGLTEKDEEPAPPRIEDVRAPKP